MKMLLSLIAYIGGFALVANEIRGIILAGPVMYAMYLSGGTGMALWLGFCSLMGIALSVIVPVVVVKKLRWQKG